MQDKRAQLLSNQHQLVDLYRLADDKIDTIPDAELRNEKSEAKSNIIQQLLTLRKEHFGATQSIDYSNPENYLPNLPKPEVNWDLNKRIFIKENGIDPKLCDYLIQSGEPNLSQATNPNPAIFDISFHTCKYTINDEMNASLQRAWGDAIEFFKMDVGFIEPYELKRYTTDDFFARHADNFWSLTEDMDRKITISVQVSDPDEYTGGDLVVLGQPVRAKKGSIVFFPSYFPHWIDKVTSGTRWALVSWAWGPYWR